MSGYERLTRKIGAPWSGAAAWASILDDGSLELELFDHSQEAANSLGGDVAWIYTVEPPRIARLMTLLGVADEAALLAAFAERFPHIHAVRDWLKGEAIPFTERFDSQA
ncbi:MAG: hypothetical protein IPJ98_14885 [Bryobacterales bacterium]|nr:hypothetical protein [Bryobacterales bacterium]